MKNCHNHRHKEKRGSRVHIHIKRIDGLKRDQRINRNVYFYWNIKCGRIVELCVYIDRLACQFFILYIFFYFQDYDSIHLLHIVYVMREWVVCRWYFFSNWHFRHANGVPVNETRNWIMFYVHVRSVRWYRNLRSSFAMFVILFAFYIYPTRLSGKNKSQWTGFACPPAKKYYRPRRLQRFYVVQLYYRIWRSYGFHASLAGAKLYQT